MVLLRPLSQSCFSWIRKFFECLLKVSVFPMPERSKKIRIAFSYGHASRHGPIQRNFGAVDSELGVVVDHLGHYISRKVFHSIDKKRVAPKNKKNVYEIQHVLESAVVLVPSGCVSY